MIVVLLLLILGIGKVVRDVRVLPNPVTDENEGILL